MTCPRGARDIHCDYYDRTVFGIVLVALVMLTLLIEFVIEHIEKQTEHGIAAVLREKAPTPRRASLCRPAKLRWARRF